MAYRYDKPDNLVDLIEDSVARHTPNGPFSARRTLKATMMGYLRRGGRTHRQPAGAWPRLGVQRGDAVGIIANNRTEWAIAAFATYGLGGRFIPMYENELEKIWKYIINDSGIKYCCWSATGDL
jgi:long-chain acyl-CoA synthetase